MCYKRLSREQKDADWIAGGWYKQQQNLKIQLVQICWIFCEICQIQSLMLLTFQLAPIDI